ncbi:MAG: hypothetical protein LBG88_04340 [Christensenellaceae bacterium]|nr:hypothetical protein [Christensenellaceae bacterium]
MEKIQTFGTRCFVNRDVVIEPPCVSQKASSSKAKAEKVNLKFGKIRVQVTGSKKVRVLQDGNAMILLLEEALTC